MRKEPSNTDQVRSGFLRALWWILGGAWFALVISGITNAFGTEAEFSEGHHPSRILGYVLLSVAAAIFVATANRWKRVFPGIMLVAALNCLIQLERGRSVGNSSVLIPRWITLIQLIVIVIVTVLSFTFKRRPLNLLDRTALLAFAASIFMGGREASRQELPISLIIGGICMLVAWTYDWLRRRRWPESSVSLSWKL